MLIGKPYCNIVDSFRFLSARTIVKEHIPKRHLNFEEPIAGAKGTDVTAARIYGERQARPMVTETSTLGTGVNPADNLPRVGRKQ